MRELILNTIKKMDKFQMRRQASVLRRKVRKLSQAQAVDAAITEAAAPYHLSVFWGDRLLTLDKSAGFLDDPEFARAYQAVKGSHTYDQYASPQTIAWRLHTLVWAA